MRDAASGCARNPCRTEARSLPRSRARSKSSRRSRWRSGPSPPPIVGHASPTSSPPLRSDPCRGCGLDARLGAPRMRQVRDGPRAFRAEESPDEVRAVMVEAQTVCEAAAAAHRRRRGGPAAHHAPRRSTRWSNDGSCQASSASAGVSCSARRTARLARPEARAIAGGVNSDERDSPTVREWRLGGGHSGPASGRQRDSRAQEGPGVEQAGGAEVGRGLASACCSSTASRSRCRRRCSEDTDVERVRRRDSSTATRRRTD